MNLLIYLWTTDMEGEGVNDHVKRSENVTVNGYGNAAHVATNRKELHAEFSIILLILFQFVRT